MTNAIKNSTQISLKGENHYDFNSIPKDLLIDVALFLPFTEIFSFKRLNKHIYSLIENSKRIWLKIYSYFLPVSDFMQNCEIEVLKKRLRSYIKDRAFQNFHLVGKEESLFWWKKSALNFDGEPVFEINSFKFNKFFEYEKLNLPKSEKEEDYNINSDFIQKDWSNLIPLNYYNITKSNILPFIIDKNRKSEEPPNYIEECSILNSYKNIFKIHDFSYFGTQIFHSSLMNDIITNYFLIPLEPIENIKKEKINFYEEEIKKGKNPTAILLSNSEMCGNISDRSKYTFKSYFRSSFIILDGIEKIIAASNLNTFCSIILFSEPCNLEYQDQIDIFGMNESQFIGQYLVEKNNKKDYFLYYSSFLEHFQKLQKRNQKIKNENNQDLDLVITKISEISCFLYPSNISSILSNTLKKAKLDFFQEIKLFEDIFDAKKKFETSKDRDNFKEIIDQYKIDLKVWKKVFENVTEIVEFINNEEKEIKLIEKEEKREEKSKEEEKIIEEKEEIIIPLKIFLRTIEEEEFEKFRENKQKEKNEDEEEDKDEEFNLRIRFYIFQKIQERIQLKKIIEKLIEKKKIKKITFQAEKHIQVWGSEKGFMKDANIPEIQNLGLIEFYNETDLKEFLLKWYQIIVEDNIVLKFGLPIQPKYIILENNGNLRFSYFPYAPFQFQVSKKEIKEIQLEQRDLLLKGKKRLTKEEKLKLEEEAILLKNKKLKEKAERREMNQKEKQEKK